MTRPDFQHVEALERLALPETAARAFAEIQLGQAPDGMWMFAIGVGVKDSAHFTGLGWWPDLPRQAFPGRLGALQAAVAYIRAWVTPQAARPGAARILAWLDGLTAPAQADLFAA